MEQHASRIVFHPDFLKYDFGPQHPLRPERLSLGLDLLETSGLWHPESETIRADAASDDDLLRVHSHEYVQAVKRASSGTLPQGELVRFGLGPGDTPAFPRMHEVSALVVGGTLSATRQIMDGTIQHAFNPGGGWHHALANRASGFCVYDDPAVAAAAAAREYGARVLYADFDCHHGDGVQWIFYDDPTVMTVSFHESGRFLFPGTGEVGEVGEGDGYGFAVNMPFAPYTQDDSWMRAATDILPAVADRFRPDIVITAHGADTHLWDPITHLCLTTESFVQQTKLAHALAHTYAGGRWLAVGSGGYDWQRVVPRSWAIVWAEMSERALPANIPDVWLSRYGHLTDEEMPTHFLDGPLLREPMPRKAETDRHNSETLAQVREVVALLDR